MSSVSWHVKVVHFTTKLDKPWILRSPFCVGIIFDWLFFTMYTSLLKKKGTKSSPLEVLDRSPYSGQNFFRCLHYSYVLFSVLLGIYFASLGKISLFLDALFTLPKIPLFSITSIPPAMSQRQQPTHIIGGLRGNEVNCFGYLVYYTSISTVVWTPWTLTGP